MLPIRAMLKHASASIMNRIFGWVVVLLLLAGCATSPLVNWDKRMGNYTYDLALLDLGPPNDSTELKDGTRVADWITRRATPGTRGLSQPAGTPPPAFWYTPFPNTLPPTPNQHLRLTFGPDQKLTAWQRYSSYSR
ncbi:MAG: hypothetical protein JWR19_2455 [Pedosphaera sp.]|nr:hypothetical protein [Pedosphaera sp.]